jgi:hypothetical protein
MSDIGTQIRDYLDGTTAPVGAREIIMGSTFTEERDGGAPGRTRSWRWVVAAAAAAAVALVGWLLLPGADDEVAPIGLTGASPAVATVEAAIEAYNAGDLEGLVAFAAPGEGMVVDWVLGPEGFVEAKMAAGARFILDEPCRDGASAGAVVCSGTDTNRYWAAAGIDRPGQYVLIVEDGAIVSSSFADAELSEPDVFGNAFLSWLEATYPEVVEGLPAYDGEAPGESRISFSSSGVPIAAAMPTALEYVDEFVAQSPDYPITP